MSMLAEAAWWTNQQAGLVGGLGGGIGGSLCGILGAAAGTMVPRGIGRTYVIGSMVALVAIGVACLIAGIVALSMGQPYHVWFVMVLPGFVLVTVCAPLIPVIRKRYSEAEQRKMDAELIRKGSAIQAG